MIQFETITLDAVPSGICTITLNRPEKHNALNAQMIADLRTAVKHVSMDPGIRVLILNAEGRSFCAGGDLHWMQEQAAKDRAGKIEESTKLAMMLQEIDNLEKPVIARVHGPAYGGGVGILCVCDIVIACDTTKFALTETRLGLIPATIGPYVVRRLGEGAARQVFMNAITFDVQRALLLGLVSIVTEKSGLDEQVQQQALAFLNCAPGAVADAKAICQHFARNPIAGQLEYSANKLADRWETEETKEGINCFFINKKPSWIPS